METVSLFGSSRAAEVADFDIGIRYAGVPDGWLTATPSRGTTPAQITLSANPANLPSGTYAAQVVATVGSLRLSAVTEVSFTVAAAASNPGGVAVSPSRLTFTPKTPGTAQTLTITNAPGTSGNLTVSLFANPSSWLTVSRSQLTTPGTLDVRTTTSGLKPGVYTGAITFAADSGKTTVIPVTLVVPEVAVGPSVILTPAQRSLIFNYQLTTSNNPPQTVYVSTDSTQYAIFTATTSEPWLGVAAASWITPARSAECFAPGLFYVKVDPNGLGSGVYTASITLSSPGITSVDLPVTFTVSSAPVLNANPSFVSLDTAASLLTSNLAITGSSAFYFTAAVAGDPP